MASLAKINIFLLKRKQMVGYFLFRRKAIAEVRFMQMAIWVP